VRVGGFGGLQGLLDYIRDESIDLVVDATHPFAQQITRNATIACWSAEVPLLRLERPAWDPHPDDVWYEVGTLADAAATVPKLGARAFLTVGAGELLPFAGLPQVWFLVRLIEAPKERLPLANYEVVLGRGPFSAAKELRLLERHGIDVVVAKNSGGDATYGKIAAARALGLPVILLRRLDRGATGLTRSRCGDTGHHPQGSFTEVRLSIAPPSGAKGPRRRVLSDSARHPRRARTPTGRAARANCPALASSSPSPGWPDRSRSRK
jgi:precorrin-6A/cobalt-precorrin-6A reductase